MRYRIKIKIFENKRTEFTTYIHKWYGWCGLNYDGKEEIAFPAPCKNRTRALELIDLNFNGNNVV